MRFTLDPGVAALFGSESRALILAPLANAFDPMTAYRIAAVAQLQRTKVYSELRRLEKAGIVRSSSVADGPTVWTLTDPDLRAFLRRRVRFWSWADWQRRRSRTSGPRRPRNDWAEKFDSSKYRPNPSAVPNPREFRRPREKDRILAELGLPRSRRGRVSR